MASPRNDMLEMAKARANVYGLLADIFRVELSQDLLSKLKDSEFSNALHTLNLSLDELFKSTSQKQLLEDLAIEFTYLFIGPGSHISPHESMHTLARFGEANELWGVVTVDVKKFMEGAGLKAAESFTGMPDHISIEFEFMQRLLLKEAEAWTAGEQELGANIIKIEKRFYDEHLSQWVTIFCDKVIKAAKGPFYRQFCEVTKAFIDFEKLIMQDLIDETGETDKLSA